TRARSQVYASLLASKASDHTVRGRALTRRASRNAKLHAVLLQLHGKRLSADSKFARGTASICSGAFEDLSDHSALVSVRGLLQIDRKRRGGFRRRASAQRCFSEIDCFGNTIRGCKGDDSGHYVDELPYVSRPGMTFQRATKLVGHADSTFARAKL